MTTMSLRLSAEARDFSTYARNVFPLIEPSITHGAVIPFRRRPATKVRVFQCPCLRYAANQSLAAPAPAAQPDHFRIGRGLVDEHQSGGIKHGLPSLPASTCPDHVRAILLRGAQAFFEADGVALEEAPHGSATACDPVLVHRRDHLIQRQIRLLLNQREQ